jgi:hypothetical protein
MGKVPRRVASKFPFVSVSPEDASRATGLPQHVIRKLIKEGLLKSHRVGRRSLLLVADLYDFVAAQGPTSRPRRAALGYDKVLTRRGRVMYKIDQGLEGLGFQGPDAYLRAPAAVR